MPAHPAALILDSNLLVLFVVGAVDERRVASLRTRAYTVADYQRMISFMARYQKLVVTPHILAETTNLLDRLSGPVRIAAFEFLRKLLNRSQTEERYEPSANLANRAEFSRLGLADAAVDSVVESGVALLTDDLDLYLTAVQRNPYQVVNFSHLREGAWDQ